ncbi:MAG: DUF3261 domain-containing protein [Deltaproteobacteria bacterium]|nr:DUF3261 domain-containing protein [Deltaproteobacteria bacterium]
MVLQARLAWLASLLWLVASGCGGPPTPAPAAAQYPTRLVDPATLVGDFTLEQQITITHAEGEHSFRAVLEKRGGRLVLLALGPHGGRGFAWTQIGREVEFQRFVPVELPFPPRYVLEDVQRVWFLPTHAPASGEGIVERDEAGEHEVERYEGGRLTSRSYARLDGHPSGRIEVDYGEGLVPGAPLTAAPPADVVLDNGWLGYRLGVHTLRWTRAPAD